MDGAADELKESVIGVLVFDRKPDYDPKIDSIVRVQARQLRAKLEEYYAGPGSNDQVRFQLPKGSYVPVIRTVATPENLRVVAINRSQPEPVAHLAVLPFRNLSSDPENEYFSDGISEEILGSLARIPGLRLIARTSAFQLKGDPRDIRQIAKQLGTECILEGSVRRAGNQVRIAAQLIDGSDGTNKWAESFDACLMDPAQVFAIQEDIAREIARHLARFFKTGAPESDVSQGQTSSVPAYESYLRARKLMREMNADSLRHAIPLLQQAIAEDPGYAAAHAALGGCYGHLGIYGGVASAEVLPKARHWAEEAVRLDPNLADGHTLLGNVAATLDLDLETARGHFERALKVDPQSPYARQSHAQWYLGPSGQTREAVQELEALLPLDPLSLELRHTYIAALYFDRRYADVIEQATTVLKLTSQCWPAYFYRWLAYEATGDHERAIEDLAAHAAALPNLLLDRHLASYRLLRAGRREEAVAIALEMEKDPRAAIVSTVLADLWLRLGDQGRAMDWLERAFESRSFRVLGIAVDAAYDPLREEPRFEGLCRRVLGAVVVNSDSERARR
jgi:TolB-like protein